MHGNFSIRNLGMQFEAQKHGWYMHCMQSILIKEATGKLLLLEMVSAVGAVSVPWQQKVALYD